MGIQVEIEEPPIVNGKEKKSELVTQWYPTLCNPLDHSLPGSSVCGILKARILEWVAIPFPGRSSPPRDQTCISLWLLHCRQLLHLVSLE